mmetsp:Transcript_15602/g.42014  ORF Transcript_15602/g.42014 Transcript_15602/m.42014 type:complete len:415 (+) Transcript_15602:1035-2279(+)
MVAIEMDVCDEAGTVLARGFLGALPSRAVLDAAAARFGLTAVVSDKAQQVFTELALFAPAPASNSAAASEEIGAGEESARFPMGGVAASHAARFLRLYIQDIELAMLGRSTGESVLPVELNEMLVMAASEVCSRANESTSGWITLFSAQLESPRVVLHASSAFSDVGLRLWTAGLVLFDLLFPLGSEQVQVPVLDQKWSDSEVTSLRDVVKGRTVLELGAGLGLTAVALHTAGAEGAILTDYTSEIVSNVCKNLRANACLFGDFKVSAELLDVVTADDTTLFGFASRAQVFLAADVTYDPALVGAMVTALEKLVELAPNEEGNVRGSSSGGSGGGKPLSRVAYLLATRRSDATWTLLQRALTRRTPIAWTDVTQPLLARSSNALQYLLPADAASISAVPDAVRVFRFHAPSVAL